MYWYTCVYILYIDIYWWCIYWWLMMTYEISIDLPNNSNQLEARHVPKSSTASEIPTNPDPLTPTWLAQSAAGVNTKLSLNGFCFNECIRTSKDHHRRHGIWNAKIGQHGQNKNMELCQLNTCHTMLLLVDVDFWSKNSATWLPTKHDRSLERSPLDRYWTCV